MRHYTLPDQGRRSNLLFLVTRRRTTNAPSRQPSPPDGPGARADGWTNAYDLLRRDREEVRQDSGPQAEAKRTAVRRRSVCTSSIYSTLFVFSTRSRRSIMRRRALYMGSAPKRSFRKKSSAQLEKFSGYVVTIATGGGTRRQTRATISDRA